jgi:hypothetical protein
MTTTARYLPIRTVTVTSTDEPRGWMATVVLADDLENDDHIVILNAEGAVIGWEDHRTGALYSNELHFGKTIELDIVRR